MLGPYISTIRVKELDGHYPRAELRIRVGRQAMAQKLAKTLRARGEFKRGISVQEGTVVCAPSTLPAVMRWMDWPQAVVDAADVVYECRGVQGEVMTPEDAARRREAVVALQDEVGIAVADLGALPGRG